MTPQQKYRTSQKGRATRQIRDARPEVRAKKREYDNRPERRAVVKKYNRLPARREAERLRNEARSPQMRDYNKRPERRKRCRELDNASYLARGPRWIKAHIQGCRKRAVDKGFPYDREAIKELLAAAPTRCPVLGIELTVGSPLRDSSTTIDKRIPANGYVRGNMTIISHLANRIKTNATASQIAAVANWVAKMEQRI